MLFWRPRVFLGICRRSEKWDTSSCSTKVWDVLYTSLPVSDLPEADVVLMFLCVSGTVCGNPSGLQDPWCVFLCMWSSHQLICRPRQQGRTEGRGNHSEVTCLSLQCAFFCCWLYGILFKYCAFSDSSYCRLIDCLRDFGPRDWHLAAVLCQTLWNFSLDGELQHSQKLLEILQLYTGAYKHNH